jgi:hypothetical protein
MALIVVTQLSLLRHLQSGTLWILSIGETDFEASFLMILARFAIGDLIYDAARPMAKRLMEDYHIKVNFHQRQII